MSEKTDEMRKYLYGIPAFTDKHTLWHTKEYCRLLGIDFPQERIIHVAGTNGKGSVCNYLRELLHRQGHKVVMFTSPHLVRLNERIVIGDEEATDRQLLTAFEKVRSLAREHAGSDELYHPTFFEFLFLMLMCICQQVQPDYLILETGLGGLLDATNIFEKPALCVITRIGLDHCRYLGDSIREIAAQKAGIIKAGVPLVLQSTSPSSDAVICHRAKELNAGIFIVSDENVKIEKVGKKSIDFSYQSHYYNIGLRLQSGALYQTKNAATALMAFEVLAREKGFTPDLEQIKEAFLHALWPGRMEEIRDGIILDGAHNEDGIEAFLASAARDGCRGKRILVFAVSDDKDAAKMTERIAGSGLFDTVIVTRYDQPRAQKTEHLAELFEGRGLSALTAENAKKAYEAALLRKQTQDRVYIAGSLYLVGEIRGLLGDQKEEVGRNDKF